MSRSLVGVSPGFAGPSEERNFCRTADILYCDHNYLRRIEEAGGLPVLLSHTDDAAMMRELAARLDGLMLSGGEDVHPAHYGQRLQSGTAVNGARDQFELHLLAEFLQTGKPVLAICRGFQVLNVALGGTLIQDIPAQTRVMHHSQTAPTATATHQVRLDEDCRLAKIFGETVLDVNSHHHQGVAEPAAELKVVGCSEEGMAEAVEHREHPYVIGVQWHPERLLSRYEMQMRLFRDFVEACKTRSLGG